MPVISGVTYYAGVVDYVSGTVIWSLDWVETLPGIAPYLSNPGLPAGQISVVFTSTTVGGGAKGTATITATVDGIPSASSITAVVT